MSNSFKNHQGEDWQYVFFFQIFLFVEYIFNRMQGLTFKIFLSVYSSRRKQGKEVGMIDYVYSLNDYQEGTFRPTPACLSF